MRVQDAASRSALPNWRPRCHAARSCRFDIPTVLGGKRPNVAAHMQLGGFTLKAKTSCKITSPPNLRKANLRCDAGLLGVSSLSLFFCFPQDAVLAAARVFPSSGGSHQVGAVSDRSGPTSDAPDGRADRMAERHASSRG